MKNIALAIDGSEGGPYVLNWVIDNLLLPLSAAGVGIDDDDGGRASLIVIHVQPPLEHYIYPAGPAAATVYATSSVIDSVKKAQEETTANILARVHEICKEKQVKVETTVMDGEPKEMICQAVEQREADLVVVGCRGLGKIKRAFLGSVSDYVAHHAKCPVLIVKPPKEHH